MKIHNLHKRNYWDSYYTEERVVGLHLQPNIFTSYDIFLCDEILKAHIPKFISSNKTKHSICELGSGDGKLLAKLGHIFNCIPYGIEYVREIALKSRKNGINVIINDAFSTSLLQKYRNHFDIVFSYGFVEHIIPPEKAIKLQIDLTKPGGYFVIQIPRFKGFNWWKIKFFRPDLIPTHNMNIMEASILENLCRDPNVKKIYCGNYGTYKLRIPMNEKNYKYYILKIICYIEYLLNPLFRLLFRSKGFETDFFSPNVMFIGQKSRGSNHT